MTTFCNITSFMLDYLGQLWEGVNRVSARSNETPRFHA
jgi:hypothetical protein